ncbi:TlpA disulfide reductase family protein [Maribellus comscasis]|nr:TlpA disulfide reductase family protein [Maribellus comscasis]
MKIFRFLVIIVLVALVFNACKKSNEFVVSGKITHAEDRTIYLEELLVSGTKPVDSMKIGSNGEFKFKGETSLPTYYLLKFDVGKHITLLIDSAEQINVEADFANFSYEYNVEGSSGSKLVKDLATHLNRTIEKLDSLRSLNDMYVGNPDYENLKAQWDEEYSQVVQEQVDYSTKFVMDNPFSMASVLALYQTFDNRQSFVINDLQTMRVAASALNSIYPNSGHVKALYANTLQILKNEENRKMQRFIQENGQNSPEIILPDPNGKEIALSSLQGKLVLLHFWAAEDRASRVLNPALVEAYQKYKNKGFEIYQVSLDNNRIEWVDAIDQDNLGWINVGDMKGCAQAVQTYNIQTVPYNYLLDKDGVVIAQNLKGPGLDRALSKILN